MFAPQKTALYDFHVAHGGTQGLLLLVLAIQLDGHSSKAGDHTP